MYKIKNCSQVPAQFNSETLSVSLIVYVLVLLQRELCCLGLQYFKNNVDTKTIWNPQETQLYTSSLLKKKLLKFVERRWKNDLSL